MLIHTKLSKHYWTEAVALAASVRISYLQQLIEHASHHSKSGMAVNLISAISGSLVLQPTPTSHSSSVKGWTNAVRNSNFFSDKGARLFDKSNNTTSTRRDVVFDESDFGRTRTSHPDEEHNINSVGSVVTIAPLTNELIGIQDKSASAEPTRTSQRYRKPLIHFGFDEYVTAARAQRKGHTTDAT